MSLAQQLLALCQEHGLSSLSVDITFRSDGSHFFGSFAHARGICDHSTVNRDAPERAIGEAVAKLKAKLGQTLIDVPELEEAA